MTPQFAGDILAVRALGGRADRIRIGLVISLPALVHLSQATI